MCVVYLSGIKDVQQQQQRDCTQEELQNGTLTTDYFSSASVYLIMNSIGELRTNNVTRVWFFDQDCKVASTTRETP